MADISRSEDISKMAIHHPRTHFESAPAFTGQGLSLPHATHMTATSTTIRALAHPRAAPRRDPRAKTSPTPIHQRDNRRASKMKITARSRRRALAAGAAPSSAGGAGDDMLRSSETEDILRRLHVAFLATRRGSRFAAQEFALVATDAYERGVSIPTLRMDISLLGLSTENRMGMSEQDAFLSNIGMAMMTLYELAWTSPGGGEGWCPMGPGIDPEEDREARGLLAYIRATHQRSDQGFTLKRMEMERMMALSAYQGQGEFELEPADGNPSQSGRPQLGRNNDRPVSQTGIGGGPPNPARAAAATESPAVVLMRVNCRLTLLLREMVFIERGLRPVTEVVSQTEQDEEDAELLAEAEEELERMKREAAGEDVVEYVNNSIDDSNSIETDDEDDDEYSSGILDPQTAPQLALEWCRVRRTRARNVAARALTAYVSALTSHPVGLRAFAAAVVDGYVAGIPARDVTASLAPEEFDVEGSRRGMFGSAADATRFFSLFVTTAYVVAEQDACEQDADECRNGFDPDGYAWAPAPGEFRIKGGGNVDANARRTVAGMRSSVKAWMEMDRAELRAQVASQLSMDEDDGVMAGDPSGAGAGLTGAMIKPAGNTPPGDLPWERDEHLPGNSITVACLTLQRMVVSFTLRELARRREAYVARGSDFDNKPEYGNDFGGA